jgi:drug/metabolite transporter (DMT)-like permease
MTPQDHNRTLGIIYAFMGGILSLAALVELIRVITIKKELERVRSDSLLLVLIITGLLLTIILLSTAYGLFKRRRWARISSLILSGIFIWLVPLGTALAIYTWSFMYSSGGKLLYSNSDAPSNRYDDYDRN